MGIVGHGWGALFVLLLLVGVAGGCQEGADAAPGAGGTSSPTSGAGGVADDGCQGSGPDGYCVAFGPAAEACTCPDCASLARCTGACKDDGACDAMGAEDCSCQDCFMKVAACAPGGGDCGPMPDGVCGFAESCTCPDCTNTAFCKEHCVDNGECVPWLEGCSCKDCKGEAECGGGPTTGATTSATTSTGSGGAGGAGGATSATSTTATTTTSTTTATSTTSTSSAAAGGA